MPSFRVWLIDPLVPCRGMRGILCAADPSGMLSVMVSACRSGTWPVEVGESLSKEVGMGGLELASVLRQLRTELNEAMDDADGERLRFELATFGFMVFW